MQYGHIDGVSKPVSRIFFGTATPKMFAAFRSVYGTAPDFAQRREEAFALLDQAWACGINTFDCADHYGEEPIGEWLEERGVRDQAVLLTKGAHHNPWRKRVTDFDILHDANNSLAKMKTDFIDIYLLHRDDPSVAVGPIMDALNRLHDEGKIGVLGVSNWSIARIAEANEYCAKHNMTPFTVTSPNYSLAEQVDDPWGGGCLSISGPDCRSDREWYAKNGFPILSYSPLARAFFSGKLKSDRPEEAEKLLDAPAMKAFFCPDNFRRLERCEILAEEKGVSVPVIATAFIFTNPDLNVFAVSGSTQPAHMQLNIDALSVKLTSAERSWLDLETDKR